MNTLSIKEVGENTDPRISFINNLENQILNGHGGISKENSYKDFKCSSMSNSQKIKKNINVNTAITTQVSPVVNSRLESQIKMS